MYRLLSYLLSPAFDICRPPPPLPPQGYYNGTINEIADTVASSSVLLGMHGAGFTNMIFMRPGTVVMQLFPYGWDMGPTHKDNGSPLKGAIFQWVEAWMGVHSGGGWGHWCGASREHVGSAGAKDKQFLGVAVCLNGRTGRQGHRGVAQGATLRCCGSLTDLLTSHPSPHPTPPRAAPSPPASWPTPLGASTLSGFRRTPPGPTSERSTLQSLRRTRSTSTPTGHTRSRTRRWDRTAELQDSGNACWGLACAWGILRSSSSSSSRTALGLGLTTLAWDPRRTGPRAASRPRSANDPCPLLFRAVTGPDLRQSYEAVFPHQSRTAWGCAHACM